MTSIRAVFLDVDGVLIDSLGSHLEYCEQKRRELGLDLEVPSPHELKALVRRGVQISPMKYFFIAVGFPADLAERADADYQREFTVLFKPRLFAGAEEMLERLASAGLGLGIVTSNTRTNISAALGSCLRHFHSGCVFTEDDERRLSKSAALAAGAAELGSRVSRVIFVGDQCRDFEAARTAGAQFLGVTYGWGIADSDDEFPVCRSLSEVSEFILARV